jgi:hypothetical protein
MKKISIGIHGDGTKSEISGVFYDPRQIRVKGGFAAEQDQIRICTICSKRFHPGFNGRQRKKIFSVLRGINITMPALEIALRQDMKKKIGRIF